MYVELQATTHFSFLRGASSPDELFAAAALLGLPALGVADRNSVAGMVRAWEASKATGVRPVAGCRLAPGAGGRHPHPGRRVGRPRGSFEGARPPPRRGLPPPPRRRDEPHRLPHRPP